MTRVSGTEGYGETASSLVGHYEGLKFEDVHRATLHLMPQRPSRILDIGAGTGRDAAALAARGHSVVAVEPTAELRTHGRLVHAAAAITWTDDSLPDLAAVHAGGERFDLVLLTAVWMHLDAGQRERAMPAVASLVSPTGRLIMSLRHGSVPAARRMFDVSAAETGALALNHGLATIHSSERGALANGEADVWWSILALQPKRRIE